MGEAIAHGISTWIEIFQAHHALGWSVVGAAFVISGLFLYHKLRRQYE